MKDIQGVNESRRKVLKQGAILAAFPFVAKFCSTELSAATIKSFTTEPIMNGEIITAAHWGILKVSIKDGKIADSGNGVADLMYNSLQHYTDDLVYTNSRVRYPMVRKSYLKNPDSPKPELRGADEWVRVSYQDAIKLVAKELKKTRKAKGPGGVFAGSYGWKSSGNMHNSRVLLHRFMGMNGGFVGHIGDYSTAASQVIMPHVVGTIEVYEQQTSWPVIMENTKVIVLWGANPLATLKIAWTSADQGGLEYFKKLKDSDKTIICIDPARSETCQFLNARWIAPIPNTDVPMMMAMAHTLLKNDTYDKDFIENYTEGFDKFKDYLLGKNDNIVKDSAWASKICGIDAKVIEELADLCYKNRTMFMSGWSMQRQHHGEQPHWMLVTLASMIGQIGLPGGGFGLSYHYSNGGIPTAKGPVIGGMGVGNASSTGGAAWLRDNASSKIPVARIADALLNPGKTIDFNGRKITYSDIDFVYWVGGNPFSHHQDTNTLIKAWRKPRTIVVNEPYWTATARFADIVFPATTSYERNDITMTGDYSNMNIVPMKQAVKKQYEARDDYQIFSDLAKELGIEKEYTDGGKDEMAWIREFYNQAYNQSKGIGVEIPKFEDFWKANQPLKFEPTPESEAWVRYKDFRDDPILNPLGTPSGKIEIYSKTIEKMNYNDCPAHPTWMEPIEWLGMKNKPAEFALVSPHPLDRLHSQLNNTSLRDKYAINGREPIWINTQDAKAKGIKDGDIVRVFNKRGQILAGAVVTDYIMKGAVRLREGAWYDPMDSKKEGTLCINGNVNVLTIDIPTSKLADGNIAHTALVNIEKYTKKAPKVNVFDHPKFY